MGPARSRQMFDARRSPADRSRPRARRARPAPGRPQSGRHDSRSRTADAVAQRLRPVPRHAPRPPRRRRSASGRSSRPPMPRRPCVSHLTRLRRSDVRASSALSSSARRAPSRKVAGSPITSMPAVARCACCSTSRGSTAPFQRLTSRRTAASTGSPASAGNFGAGAEAHRAAARASGAQRERDVARPPPALARCRAARTVRAATAAGCPCRRARAARAPPPARARAGRPARPRRLLSVGTRSSGVSTAAACLANCRAERVDASRARSTGRRRRGGRRSASGGRSRRAGRPAGRRPGSSGPSRCPLRRRGDQDRRAVVALGDPAGDDADHARMPVVGGEHVGGLRRPALRSASRRRRGCGSRRRGARR